MGAVYKQTIKELFPAEKKELLYSHSKNIKKMLKYMKEELMGK